MNITYKVADYTVPEVLLSHYVQFASVTGVEKEAGEFLAHVCRELGLHVRVFTDEIDSYNFAASLYPLDSKKPNIIFLNHIDVVPAGDVHKWTHPPFSGIIDNDEVWGRGAIDNKGMAVTQLLSIANFINLAKDVDLPFNVTLLSVSNEETGGLLGASIIAENHLNELNPVVVYGEGGTGVLGAIKSDPDFPVFGISVAQKRGLWFVIEASNNLSGHGSMPRNQYPNKEVVMASKALLDARPQIILIPPVREMIRTLGKHEGGRRKFVLRNISIFAPFFTKTLREDPLLAAMIANTMTLTNLYSTLGADNQVSNQAKAVFDCRLLPQTDTDKFLKYVKKKIKNYDVSLRVIHETPRAPVSETGYYYNAMEQAILNVYGDVGVTPIMFLANNDNAYFRMNNIPAYGIMPVVLSRAHMETIHMVDERIPVPILYKGIKAYTEMLRILLEVDEDVDLSIKKLTFAK
ncbi:MAG: M20/M25/M40 family metallo-hydrolase [Bacteroidetes bacterium]|nr:M20/M25/M40 family metallo-hydrolase [Bacteroidota bacterium]